jgi:acylaminoacyl-peptidase
MKMRYAIAGTSLWIAMLAPPARAAAPAAPADRLAVQDIFQIELAAEPQISPDGRRVVYVRRFADVMTDSRKSNLWIVNADGAGHRPLTTGGFSDTSPRWSPDGSQIAYISDRDGSAQIHRMFLDTGQTQKVTSLTSEPSGIAWSPDGRWISFAAHVPEAPPRIAAMPEPPEGAEWAEPAKVIDRLIYRYNRAGYLKPGFVHLFVVPAEGGTPRQVTSGPYQHGGLAFEASEAVWTPDGRFLIQSVNRRPDYELEPLDTEVYEFPVAGGPGRALTSRRGPDNSPTVSPDGRQIAYVGFDDRYQGYQVTRLYVMNRDGGNPRLLTAGLDRDVESPRWAPDGRGIYFMSDDRGNTGLYHVALDGRVRQIARNAGTRTSAYSGGADFTVAKTGAYAMTWTRPHVPGDIAVGPAAGGAPRVVTAVNEDLLGHKTLGEVEEIWYDSSLDGRKIHGWIVRPPGFDPGGKYPLILEIHGGPFANYGDRFDLEKQLMAAAGYVVLYVNPRGSTSYGEEFGNLIHHRYPGDDFHDLNAGVDAAVARGSIDPGRLYVTGGSGGGVLTCWMIGRTDRFRAAVTVYPVINWYSFNLTTDIGAFVTRYWFPGFPWDHVEHYEKRSLLSVVKNVKTPTMVLTGEEDYRTPMSESEQYYQALKLLGVETVLVRVPGEPHGIQARPSHHVSKVQHILGWFDRHRGAPGAGGGPRAARAAGGGAAPGLAGPTRSSYSRRINFEEPACAARTGPNSE